MADEKYCGSQATNTYINISDTVVAGMILDDGNVLKVEMKSYQNQVEVQRQSKISGKDHSVTLERLPDGSIIRTTVYYGFQFSRQLFNGPTNGDEWWSGESVRD